MNADFLFGNDKSEIDDDSVRVWIPKSVKSSDELFRTIADGLRFPDWFGRNWNALFDCLCDFTWLSERRIIIAHEDVPLLPSDQLREYLNVLRDAVRSWRANPGPHELVVVFPEGTRLSWMAEGAERPE
ncbi:MAG: barstar family protein [Opitutaceae bacterium]